MNKKGYKDINWGQILVLILLIPVLIALITAFSNFGSEDENKEITRLQGELTNCNNLTNYLNESLVQCEERIVNVTQSYECPICLISKEEYQTCSTYLITYYLISNTIVFIFSIGLGINLFTAKISISFGEKIDSWIKRNESIVQIFKWILFISTIIYIIINIFLLF